MPTVNSTTQPSPAEAFPVGQYLRDELEARGWSVADFAAILGRPSQAVSEILNGHKEITRETATEIASATGTSAETWLRLQDAYFLWRSAGTPSDKLDKVERRALMAGLAPVRELCRRGFLPDNDLGAQERGLRALFGVADLAERPRWAVAARRHSEQEDLSPAQLSWVAVVRWVAAQTSSVAFDRDALIDIARGLTRALAAPRDLVGLPGAMREVGVRLVHVEKFDGSKIDGVAYVDDHGPVIGVSARIARFDSVVFTILHEIAHIVRGDVDSSVAVDVDLAAASVTTVERAADDLAGHWIFPDGVDLRPPFSRARVAAWARTAGVHPAFVVGCLQADGRLPWSHLRGLVPESRSPLEEWSVDLIRRAQETRFQG